MFMRELYCKSAGVSCTLYFKCHAEDACQNECTKHDEELSDGIDESDESDDEDTD